MKLPRDLSGHELAKMLRRFGYETVRQAGSHLQLKTRSGGAEHLVTIPAHKTLKTGTLNAILTRIADYLKVDRASLIKDLLGNDSS